MEVVLRKSDESDDEGLEIYLSGGKCSVIARGCTFRATVLGVVCDDIFHRSCSSVDQVREVCVDAVVGVNFYHREFGALGKPVFPAALSECKTSTNPFLLPVPTAITWYSLLRGGKISTNNLSTGIGHCFEHFFCHLLLVRGDKLPTAFPR